MKGYIVALALVALVPAAFLQSASAAGMTQSSSGGSLDVMVEPQWGQDRQVQLKVSFLQPNSSTVQQHIDYEVKVFDNSGKQVFSAVQASGVPNQPTLHTSEGVVTIPVKLPADGDYKIEVDMAGILFNPIPPEKAEFSVTATPEFPVGVLAAVVVAMSSAIAVTRLKMKA